MPEIDQSLLNRVARRLNAAPEFAQGSDGQSILQLAARAYTAELTEDDVEEHTRPTGFNPNVAALFEAVIESAFLVANADGEFDATELLAFKNVVVVACSGKVTEAQVDALVADFADQLREDGMDKRIAMVARVITRPEAASEVLRVAGLLAAASRGISNEERSVLERMAQHFGVGRDALDHALREVELALQS